ncbi:hypothetical protein GF325_11850 [Candidatus Bathyarchaeota archaeon]|nr:hypothetical protein [Candidatus Bathyarchaeota archaeon]
MLVSILEGDQPYLVNAGTTIESMPASTTWIAACQYKPLGNHSLKDSPVHGD